MRTVFLFGAGASYGAGGVWPDAPPLMGGLYGALAREYARTWGGLPTSVRTEFARDFEGAMAHLWASPDLSRLVPGLMRDIGGFFARFRVRRSEDNAYRRLITLLRAAGRLDATALATLNYECVLEIATVQAGSCVSYFGDVPTVGATAILKLHGSCNFIPDARQVQTASGLAPDAIVFGSGLTMDPRLVAVPSEEAAAYCASDTPFYPAMAVITDGKPIQIGLTAIRELQAQWRELVRQASVLAVVGVRPNPQDTHIWDVIAQAECPVLYVGDVAAFEHWASTHRAGKDSQALGEYFAPCVGALVDAL